MNRREVIRALRRVRRKAAAGEYRDYQGGVCCRLRGELGMPGPDWIDDLVRDGLADWPLNSGEAGFPVPGGSVVYFDGTPRWSGRMLGYRLSLIDHLIGKLERKEI